MVQTVKLWKWYCLTCTGDKALKDVDRCGSWLQKAFSSSGSALASHHWALLPTRLSYVLSAFLVPDWKLWALCQGSKGRNARTKETASAVFQLTQPPTSPMSGFWLDLVFVSLLPGPSSASASAVVFCKACAFFAWLGTMPLTSLHSPSTLLHPDSCVKCSWDPVVCRTLSHCFVVVKEVQSDPNE